MHPTTAAEPAPGAVLAPPAGARRTTARRVASWLVGAAAASVALIGLGHVGPGKRLLGGLFGAAAPGCPVSLKGLSPQEIEAHRASSSLVLAGEAAPKSRGAGPFVIGATTRGDVTSWALATKVRCDDAQERTALRCIDVPGAALGAGALPVASDVLVRFDPGERVVALDVMRAAEPEAVASALEHLLRDVEARVGPRSALIGELSPAYFAGAGLKVTTGECRFTNYAVDVSATRTADTGAIRLREQYRAVGR